MAGAAPAATPKHILFAFVDHFEPTGSAPGKEVAAWVDDYIAMASRHVDADGRHPIHSYFLLFGSVPIDKTSKSAPAIDPDCLEKTLIKLNQVTYAGYGEVEFHCHHGIEDESKRTEEEAAVDLLNLIVQAREDFNRHGALVTAEPSPRFTYGFIHGMWALDNSRIGPGPRPGGSHREFCGVNRELELLSQNGAYADFTFPAWGTMEPPRELQDAIFYAADDNSPASYKKLANVRLVEVGQPPWGDLMIVEGPHDNANIGSCGDWATLWRMHGWVAHDIHVLGNGEWIFIKVHTHGLAGDVTDPATWDCFFGATMDRFYSDIEKSYNDGVSWKLHYVSAREMYNIIKAAEAGKTGDPNAYRDFLIPPYANMRILTQNPYKLVRYGAGDVILELIELPPILDLSFRRFPVLAGVFESDDAAGPWQLSDAIQVQGPFGELQLFDLTPSRFYRIVSPKSEPQAQLPRPETGAGPSGNVGELD
jgi:hypothetical protein